MRSSRLVLSTALVLAGLGLAPAGSSSAAAPAARKAPFEVTIRASTTELVLGDSMTIKGTVSPAAAGKPVTLQKKLEGQDSWVDEEVVQLNRRGKYVFELKPSSSQARKFRVIKPANKKRSKGVSNAVSIDIFQWFDLTQLAYRSSDYVYSTTVKIDGEEYPNSLYSTHNPAPLTATRDYNLERACLTMKATPGMSDDADTEASAKVDLTFDDTTAYSKTFSLTEHENVTLDLRDVFRLEVMFTTLDTSYHAVPALGSPRVLCSF